MLMMTQVMPMMIHTQVVLTMIRQLERVVALYVAALGARDIVADMKIGIFF